MTESQEASTNPAGTGTALERLAQELLETEGAGSEESDKRPSQAVRALFAERYSGPFSHPDILAKFGEVVENGAERAFSIGEREQAHRHSCELQLVEVEVQLRLAEVEELKAHTRVRYLVVVFTFVTVGVLLATSVYALVAGKVLGASFFGSGTLLAGLFGAVALRRSNRSNE